MRILLVQHAKENTEAYPVGLGIVGGVLRAAGHEVGFLDLALTPGDPVDALADRVYSGPFEALGFTLVTPQYDEFLALARRFRRRLPGIPVIAGGVHAQALPEETLRDGGVDIVVLGEGETVAPGLFAALGAGGRVAETGAKGGLAEIEGALAGVAGIAFLDRQGRFQQTSPAAQVSDLDTVPYPPWDLIHPDRYPGRFRGQRFANVITSRGCPFRCVYCHRGATGGRRVRWRSVEHVLGEVRALRRDYGIGAFGFRDDIFTLNRERTIELCAALAAEPGRVYWNCETRVDCVDAELVAQMKRAGCVCIDFGIESGSDEILGHLRKQATVEQARQALRYCHEARMPTRAFYMLGTPWETPETAVATIALAKELKATISLFFLAMPYPGTGLCAAFLEAGWPVPNDYAAYRHYVEGRGFVRGTGEGASASPQDRFAALCREATRTVVRAQLADLRGYPRLLRDYLTRYTPAEFASRTRDRLRRVFF